jgi:anthraniloyl-CoA monooxygenase
VRIVCIGAGPAGLFFGILAARRGHQVTVLEQQDPADSFGWGVVFWDGLLNELDVHDPDTTALIRRNAYRWIDQTVVVRDSEPVRIPSYGYSMRRRLLLELLRSRAEKCGVQIEPIQFRGDPAQLRADLVIASDGANSQMRAGELGFCTRRVKRRNKYIWLGSDKEFSSFTFPFVDTSMGWLWAHAYGFEEGFSTFVVECAPETWVALGFHMLDSDATVRRLEHLFEPILEGHRLYAEAGSGRRQPWTEFVEVRNRRWHVGNLALMGDAAHTTHFTIGSGTRLAMEDAVALMTVLTDEISVEDALKSYEQCRRHRLRSMQRLARRSARWFEQVPRYIGRSSTEVAALMDNRRSPVMAHLPVGAYLALTEAAAELPFIEAPLRRLVSKL